VLPRYDLTSWTCDAFGCYYAAFTNSYGYLELPPNAAQMNFNGVRLHGTLPPDSGSSFSQRCYVDLRTDAATWECISLAGFPIDVTWEPTGETDVINGLRVFEIGSVTVRIAGHSSFALASASGSILDQPVYDEEFSYIAADGGSTLRVEITPR
jgi:hypothetical protein